MKKFHLTEVSDPKNPFFNFLQKIILLVLTLILLIILPYYFWDNFCSSLQCSNINLRGLKGIEIEQKCDIFKGKWVPFSEKPYYNQTCNLIIDQQNCLKFGRNDTQFLQWRWQPNQCDLPLFDAIQFLDIVKGKSMAFVGDSVGRNQMQSLLCLLSSVGYPEDISENYSSIYDESKRYFYKDYNFTLAMFWSPYLVENKDVDPNSRSRNNLMNLYLDKADENWASKVENFDYVIISAGQWFFRPVVYYENDQIVGCRGCDISNITAMTHYYGYRKAFRTVFKTLINLKNYKGVTFLRTFSPSHFENGDWNKGGNCPRTMPFNSEAVKLDGYRLQFYLTQVEELIAAGIEGRKKGLRFRVLETTEAMIMRPDAHPNYYGRVGNKNGSLADCVHWCLPGPIDTWNEFLIYLLKMKDYRFFNEKLQNNS